MNRWRVLISAPYFQPVLEEYRERLEAAGCMLIVPDVEERLEEQELLEMIRDIDGVICGDDRFTRRVIEAAPVLKVISKWGTGIDSIDLEAATEHGVAVCNTPGAFTEPVADTTMGYLLLFARRQAEMDVAMKAGRWEKIPGFALGERKLGIIGVGNIGKAVARRARAFGMSVLGHDIVEIDSAFVAEVGLDMVSKHELLEQADMVTLHCDLNPTSHHLMDTIAFAAMKPGAFLVNTARGPCVSEVALVEALDGGRLAGVALDVFEQEPLPDDSRLLEFEERALLAPHNSNSSPTAWERVHENTIRNLLRELQERSE